MSETKKKKSFREIILSWGAKLLLALLILSFGVWGIGDYVTPQHSATAVATIGEIEISSHEFQSEVRQQFARLQGIFGGNFTTEQAKALGIGDSVLQSLIQQRLFAEGAKSMGLLVSNDLVSREIHDDSRFKLPGGDFNRLAFNETIQRAG
ncbi:MAG: SurA N-terminal domain-containing protein, partial [Rhodospirillales bacterium]|nr:SurA N-terminal domain-containing protein [Rhodospirillales bacterium]